MSNAQMDLIQWEPPQTDDADPRSWEERTFRQDGARIEAKITQERSFRGWYDMVLVCYDPDGVRRLTYRGQAKAGLDEVQVYADHWFRPLTEGRVPRGVPLYKLFEVRGEEVA